ncbi:uncharacterized protein [Pagrus major]|uniref:uncharacterized protein n=1 Tax=Pagrus major TaxID=143350 RepID=UPI003CC88288
MNIHHVVLFCFSSAVIDGNAGLVDAQTKMEGEDFTIQFALYVPPGSRIYLSRNDGGKEEILVETHGNRMQSGRFRIRYDKIDLKVHAVITDLNLSDTGRYEVGVGDSSSHDPYGEFEIKVRALCEQAVYEEPRVYSSAEGGNITIECSLSAHALNRKFLCRDKCHRFLFDTHAERAMSNKYEITQGKNGLFNVTITRLTWSDSGRYSCGVGRRERTNQCQAFEITVTGGGALRPLVCLTVVVLLVGCVLLLYKWRIRIVDYVNTRGSAENPETSVYDDCAPVSTYEGSLYLDLDPHGRDHSPYCTLETSPYVDVEPSRAQAQSSVETE